MQIRARLDETTIRQLLGELLPTRILIDDRGDGSRWIQVEEATEVDFVADQGLRIQSRGQIQWAAAGVPIAVTLNAIQLMIRPEVVSDSHGGRLLFRASVEDLDLKNVPGFIDRGVLGMVNGRLKAQADELAWDFGRALNVRVPLPITFVPPETFHVTVRAASAQVLADAIELDFSFDMSFARLPAP